MECVVPNGSRWLIPFYLNGNQLPMNENLWWVFNSIHEILKCNVTVITWKVKIALLLFSYYCSEILVWE